MRDKIYNLLSGFISFYLIILAGVTPLLFLNLTTDYYNIPKLILLVVSVMILTGLWILSWIVRGKVVITRTPLDIPLIMLLMIILVSTYYSTSRYSSIFGVFPDVHGSAIAWITYILLYFITVSNLHRIGQVKALLYMFYLSGVVISLISILSFFQIFLPFEIARGVNFTPTGLTFSTVALLLMIIPIPLVAIVNENSFLPKPVAILLAMLFSITIALIGSTTFVLLLFLIYLGVLFVTRANFSIKNATLLAIPLVIFIVFTALTNVTFSGNTLQTMKSNFPQEVQLPAGISWKIAASVFRDAPLLGTGPATFLFDFTIYRPVEFNGLSIWNFSFSTAYNEFFQFLATLGFLGMILLLLFSILILNSSRKYLFLDKFSLNSLRSSREDTQLLLPGLAMSGVIAVLLLFIHSSTLITVFTMLFTLAAFMSSQKHIRENISNFSVGIRFTTSKNNYIDLLPIFIFVLYIVAAVPLSGRIYNAVVADYYHRLALSQADSDGSKTYEYLQKAETLNPYIDLYRIDLAQTNFALANSLATQKGPTEQNPEGTLTDQDRQTIQTLISQSINEGRAAVVLSPRSSRNWEVLALIYRNITGVANNSLTFSLDAYGRSIQLDPMNPVLRLNVGSIYYATGDYDMAIRFFTDSVNLKPDYVNGYYNLAIALREKGDLENAELVANQAVRLLQQDFGSDSFSNASEAVRQIKIRDFNTATELLNQIRNDINLSTQGNEEESALQNSELPNINVPDLENPPDAQLPPAVEVNPDAVLPQ